MQEWIKNLFDDENMLKKGHCQRLEDYNLGMGWLYYGLTRLIRPANVVVIGSYRGFSPLVFARALNDNLEKGTVYFIDPSYVDDFWKDPKRVKDHFEKSGIKNIKHFLMTTQEFTNSREYSLLKDVGIVFIDGYHSEEQATFDFEAFEDKISTGGIFLFHDSVEVKTTPIYGKDKIYRRRVKFFIDKLKKRADLQVLDLPYAKGLSLVTPLHGGNK